MKHKRIVRLRALVVLCSAAFLTACQKMPDSVAEQQKHYGENPIIENVELQYCTLEQLKETKMSDITYVPDNMILPEQVDFSAAEEVDILELAFYKDYMQQRDEIAEEFSILYPVWEDFSGALHGYTSSLFDDAQKSEHLSVSDNGQIILLKKRVYEDLGDSNGISIEKIIRYPKTVSTEDICCLKQEKVAVKDVIEWMERYLKECPVLSHDFAYRVQTVYVRELADSTERVSALATLSYKGLVLDYFGGGIQFVDNYPKVGQMDAFVELTMDSMGQIDGFSNNGQFVVTSVEKLEKVVSPETAIRLVEKEISGFQEMEIADIKLLYALYPEYDYKAGTEYYGAPGNVVRARPVYSFMIAYGQDDSEVSIIENNTFCYVNVDMVTREITTNIEEKGFTLQ